jgi:CheY-like chemotaxis protein
MPRVAVHGHLRFGPILCQVLPGVEELHISREQTEIPEGISAAEWMGMQQQFIDDGVERCREFLVSLDKHVDAVRIARQLHQWAGTAGQLGFHSITDASRQVELLMRDGPFRESEVRERLSDLLLDFSDQRDRMAGVPEHFAQALRGKNVAVIGFPQSQTHLVCTALGRTGARPRIFSANEDLGCESVRDCDLVVVRLTPGADFTKLQAAAGGPLGGKLFLAGERSHLMALPPTLQSSVVDFLFDGWEADELLLRLAMALQRKTPPVFAAPEKPGYPTGEQRARVTTIPRVVAVDDDPIMLALLRTTFRNQGTQCETADNGRDALRLIREVTPSVVVLDVNMPLMDGFEVLSAIRTENIPTQVVLLTARQQEHDVLRGFQLGADDYLVKPFSPLELVARIKRLIVQTHKTAA